MSLQLGSGSAVGGKGSGDPPMSLALLRGGEEVGTGVPGGKVEEGVPEAQ